MFDDNDIKTQVIIGLTILTFCFTVATCTSIETMSDNQAVVKMVENGADPMVAKCAVMEDTTTACQIALAKPSK